MSISIDGVIRENNIKKIVHPVFAKFKKHYCKACSNPLRIVWISQTIYRGSPEAEGKDLVFGPAWLFKKPIKYTFAIFECISCGEKISISDQYIFEKPNAKPPKYDDYHQYLKTQYLKK